jgi:hypothetical protein
VKGGGKQTNQSALWTGGVALTDCRGAVGPLDKVLKIWLDETLAYDATGTGPISYASSLGVDLASVMRIYLGSNDQAVDPAYSDYCEERYGPNSAPAFRGTSMLVFDRMPLDNFGNRPPQISALVVSAAADAFPYERLHKIVRRPGLHHSSLGCPNANADLVRDTRAPDQRLHCSQHRRNILRRRYRLGVDRRKSGRHRRRYYRVVHDQHDRRMERDRGPSRRRNRRDQNARRERRPEHLGGVRSKLVFR